MALNNHSFIHVCMRTHMRDLHSMLTVILCVFQAEKRRSRAKEGEREQCKLSVLLSKHPVLCFYLVLATR